MDIRAEQEELAQNQRKARDIIVSAFYNGNYSEVAEDLGVDIEGVIAFISTPDFPYLLEDVRQQQSNKDIQTLYDIVMGALKKLTLSLTDASLTNSERLKAAMCIVNHIDQIRRVTAARDRAIAASIENMQ